jgi:hypothetical protein
MGAREESIANEPGNYSVPITITLAGGTTQNASVTIVVQ